MEPTGARPAANTASSQRSEPRAERKGADPPPEGRHRGDGARGKGRFGALLRALREGAAEGARGGHAANPRSGADRGEAALGKVLRELGEGARGAPRERERPQEETRDALAPFQPPPPALIAPPTHAVASPPAGGSAAAHAEAAALAERLVTSMRVGRVGRDGHEVRMRLALRAGAGVEVRLRQEGDRLTAVLVGDAGQRGEAARIAEALERELSERGVALDSISVE